MHLERIWPNTALAKLQREHRAAEHSERTGEHILNLPVNIPRPPLYQRHHWQVVRVLLNGKYQYFDARAIHLSQYHGRSAPQQPDPFRCEHPTDETSEFLWENVVEILRTQQGLQRESGDFDYELSDEDQVKVDSNFHDRLPHQQVSVFLPAKYARSRDHSSVCPVHNAHFCPRPGEHCPQNRANEQDLCGCRQPHPQVRGWRLGHQYDQCHGCCLQ